MGIVLIGDHPTSTEWNQHYSAIHHLTVSVKVLSINWPSDHPPNCTWRLIQVLANKPWGSWCVVDRIRSPHDQSSLVDLFLWRVDDGMANTRVRTWLWYFAWLFLCHHHTIGRFEMISFFFLLFISKPKCDSDNLYKLGCHYAFVTFTFYRYPICFGLGDKWRTHSGLCHPTVFRCLSIKTKTKEAKFKEGRQQIQKSMIGKWKKRRRKKS